MTIAAKKLVEGTVYLIHFFKPASGKTHYVGFTTRTPGIRLAEHLSGDGARLFPTDADCTIARTWPNQTMRLERKLKANKNLRRVCPICMATPLG